MNSAEIQKQIEKWQGRLADVRKSQSEFQARSAELENERRSLIVDARAKKNDSARARIEKIAEEQAVIARELRDDSDAVTECQSKLSELNRQLSRARFEEHRDRVAEAVRSRLAADYEGKCAALVQQLRQIAIEWKAGDEEMQQAIQDFDRDLAAETSIVNFKARELLYDILSDAFRAGSAAEMPWPGPTAYHRGMVEVFADRRKAALGRLLQNVLAADSDRDMATVSK